MTKKKRQHDDADTEKVEEAAPQRVHIYSCGCGHEWEQTPQVSGGVECPKCQSSTSLRSREKEAE